MKQRPDRRAALLLGWPAAAVAAAAAGLTAFAAMSRQLFGFARLVHRIVEAVARQCRLVAVEPVRIAPPAPSQPG
jgi:hypothetical protein